MLTPALMTGMGVYAVSNLVDDGVYIGSAANIGARWEQHRAALEHVCHPNDAFQAIWLRLGARAFQLSVLEQVSSAEDLAQAEQRWIDRYVGDGIHRVYNAHSRAIHRRLTPLSVDQAARRLHLSARRLQQWVKDGRVACHYAPPRPASQSRAEPMCFDREELNAVVEVLRQPHRNRVDELVVRLRGLQHRIGHLLHLVV